MKKIITDNLRLSIKYLVEIGELINQISDFSGKGLERKFEDYYSSILSGESYIYYFKNGLHEWLQQEECVIIKKSFIKELKVVLKSYEKRNIIWFPFPQVKGKQNLSGKHLDKLDEKLPQPDILHPEYLIDTRNAIKNYDPYIPETFLPVISAFKSLQKLINYEITMFLFDIELEVNEKSVDKPNVTQLEKDCYIKDWIRQKVNPIDWIKFEGIIIQDELARRKVEKEIQDKVFKHQTRLFYEITLKQYRERFFDVFNQIENHKYKYEVANTDLALLSDMIRGNLNELKTQLITDAFDIVDIPKVASQINQIARRKFYPYHFDIHHEENILKAYALYKYKKYLNNYLKHSAPAQTLFEKESIPIARPTFRYIYFDKYPDKISLLYNTLKVNNFIAAETDKRSFEAIFSGYSLKKAIIWTGSIAALKAMISTLTHKDTPLLNISGNKWAVTSYCFTSPNGKSINPKSLRTARRSKKTVEFNDIVKLLT